MWWSVALLEAHAGEGCERVSAEPLEIEVGGSSAIAIRGIEASVQLVPSEGSLVRITGTSCGGGVSRLVRRDGVIVATARAPSEADAAWRIEVPAGIETVTVFGMSGPLTAEGVDTHLAVVSSDGPVAVSGVRSLRVAYGTGPVTAAAVRRDVVVEDRVGPVQASEVGGDVLANRVEGGVVADAVGGSFAIDGQPARTATVGS